LERDVRPARDEGFGPFRHLAPGEEHAPSAGQAFQPDVGAQTHHAPLVPAARVRLAQAQNVVEAKIEGHEAEKREIKEWREICELPSSPIIPALLHSQL
jgi:hypothetical protein